MIRMRGQATLQRREDAAVKAWGIARPHGKGCGRAHDLETGFLTRRKNFSIVSVGLPREARLEFAALSSSKLFDQFRFQASAGRGVNSTWRCHRADKAVRDTGTAWPNDA